MQHDIPIKSLGPTGSAMGQAIDKCVHCGLCLAVCPTYSILQEEMDSPRGRIFLMKEALEGSLETDEMMTFIDRCLGCVACTTACPSGVEYGDLLTPFRAQAEEKRSRSLMGRVRRRLIRETVPYPSRFRAAYRMGKLAGPLRRFAPSSVAPMLDLLPQNLPSAPSLPAVVPAQGTQRARVALMTGCIQQVLQPEINWATARVLARNGVEVVVPQKQGCCGALSIHIGEHDQARSFARDNFRSFPTDVDAIITNAAGCGSGVKEYTLLFREERDEEIARTYAERTMDISVFLDRLGIDTPKELAAPLRLAYHDACHLAHAQRITQEPRRLLRSIPGLELLELPEGDMCCGSAGTYNMEQPDLARQLGERKIANSLSVRPDVIASGNIGCLVQMQNHSTLRGSPIPVLHTIAVLDRAYRGVSIMTGTNGVD